MLTLIFACFSELEKDEEKYVSTGYFRLNNKIHTTFNRSATDGAILLVELKVETPKPLCEEPLD
jgi:hypothetical protein